MRVLTASFEECRVNNYTIGTFSTNENLVDLPIVPICWADAVAGIQQYLKYCLGIIWSMYAFKESEKEGCSLIEVSWPMDLIKVSRPEGKCLFDSYYLKKEINYIKSTWL